MISVFRNSINSSAFATRRRYLALRVLRWRPTTKKTSTRPDSVAGLRGFEPSNVRLTKCLAHQGTPAEMHEDGGRVSRTGGKNTSRLACEPGQLASGGPIKRTQWRRV